MIAAAARGTQVIVVTHSQTMRERLAAADAVELELHKEWGETRLVGQTQLTQPPWDWGKR
jgi:predicted ATPase